MIHEALKSLNEAEKAVISAQGNPGSAEFQRAYQKLQLAKERVAQAKSSGLEPDGKHRLDLASEHLIHLHETMEALQDQL
ncbi:hypothetical protein GKZ89_12460 [Bacillus mangrovi]|uniref:DUF2524 domain-containing protein n=1 Tax=Metabacillus mangrovi TaxID=1491830 RepID=A0A7X2S652_9BACI|nr:hypothetical protein [Metabacillus mangrovi]MTH54215.1 hypothetical protein [Metabacillus mangrovi]